jgi:hypothetical protein
MLVRGIYTDLFVETMVSVRDWGNRHGFDLKLPLPLNIILLTILSSRRKQNVQRIDHSEYNLPD